MHSGWGSERGARPCDGFSSVASFDGSERQRCRQRGGAEVADPVQRFCRPYNTVEQLGEARCCRVELVTPERSTSVRSSIGSRPRNPEGALDLIGGGPGSVRLPPTARRAGSATRTKAMSPRTTRPADPSSMPSGASSPAGAYGSLTSRSPRVGDVASPPPTQCSLVQERTAPPAPPGRRGRKRPPRSTWLRRRNAPRHPRSLTGSVRRPTPTRWNRSGRS
jgi:hypothetical protein